MIWVSWVIAGGFLLLATHAMAYGNGKTAGWDAADDQRHERWDRIIGPDGTRWVVVRRHLEKLP